MAEVQPSAEDSNADEDPVGDDGGKTLEEEIDEISELPGCSISEQSVSFSVSSNVLQG